MFINHASIKTHCPEGPTQALEPPTPAQPSPTQPARLPAWLSGFTPRKPSRPLAAVSAGEKPSENISSPGAGDVTLALLQGPRAWLAGWLAGM